MDILQEKAELISKLSYDYCKLKNNTDNLITYKKALEFDESTADKIIDNLNSKLNREKINDIANKHGGQLKYVGKELVIISNFQYVDYYRYKLLPLGDTANLEIKFVDGEISQFYVANLSIYKGQITQKRFGQGDTFYIPHIYEPIFMDNDSYKVENLTELEYYLKFLIIEDRLINPYILYSNDIYNRKIMLPMKEKLEYLDIYEKEINFMNYMLKVTGGYLIFDKYNNLLHLNAMLEYLQKIDAANIINILSEYKDESKLKQLNYPLYMANKEAFGLVADKGLYNIQVI